MSHYQVTQAAASVVAEDGSRSLLYLGDVFAGEAADAKHLAMLVDEGFVAEVELIDPVEDAPKPGTEAAILAEIGEDKSLAEIALAEEKAKDKPRKGLVAKLEAIVAGGSGS